MPRTIESMIDHAEEARRRINTGRAVWDEKIRAVRIEGAPFEENRDRFVAALERSRWFRRQDYGDIVHELWDEIKDAETVEHFDSCLDALYDEADDDRVWIEFAHERSDAST